MIQQQQTLMLSPYAKLYEIVVPKDNMLRQINELVDFGFIYEELKDKYCLVNGRNAIDPIGMFKYLLLKAIFELSDVDIVERSRYDLSFKYFLGIAPEDPVLDPSSLTKFRKLRLKDMNLLDMLIGKTVELTIEKEILKSTSSIVDATHTKALQPEDAAGDPPRSSTEAPKGRLLHGRNGQSQHAGKEHGRRAGGRNRILPEAHRLHREGVRDCTSAGSA
jgi:transposase